MLAFLRSWLLAVVGTALICGIVRSLAPEGMGKKTVSVICGFVMLGAVLGFRGIEQAGTVEEYVGGFTAEAEEFAREAQEAGQTQTRFIIEEKCEAYILDKAAKLGVPLAEVSVTARWSEEGFWVPAECVLDTELDAALSSVIASDLGIPMERQTWRTYDE